MRIKFLVVLITFFNLIGNLFSAFEYRFYGYKSSSLGDIVSVVKQSSFFGNPAIYVDEYNFFDFGTVDIFGLGLVRGYKAGTLFNLNDSLKMGLNYQYLGNTSKIDFLNYKEEIFSVIFSKRFSNNLSLGLSINSGISEIEKQGSFTGLDLGLLYKYRNLRAGFYCENFNNPDVDWQTETTEKLDSINKLGLSYEAYPFTLYIERGDFFSYGFEYDIKNMEFYFGYFKDSYPSFSFGLSVFLYKNIELNYSIRTNENIGNTQMFNVNLIL